MQLIICSIGYFSLEAMLALMAQVEFLAKYFHLANVGE